MGNSMNRRLFTLVSLHHCLISTKCGDSIQDSLSQSVSAPDLLLNSTKQSAAILFKKKNLSKMDECGIRPMSIQAEVEPNMRFGAHDGVPPGATNKFLDLTSSASYDSRLGITPHQGPQHPRLVTLESRLATFQTWPPGLRQRPEEMAKAGFFYEGVSDQVKCFSCDGGLGSWEEGDCPQEEHAKWFPACTFLQLTLNNNLAKASTPSTNGPSKDMCARALDQNVRGNKTISLEELSEDKDDEMRQEIQRLRDERSCKICLEKEACIVFLPCGHLTTCVMCAPSLDKCPLCRSKIEALVRAFLT